MEKECSCRGKGKGAKGILDCGMANAEYVCKTMGMESRIQKSEFRRINILYSGF
jgi:hypothetical protein